MSTELKIRTFAGTFPDEIPRHWFGGSPFATHLLNALSSTFPFGEAFFVRSVMHVQNQIDDPGLLSEIDGFAGQEGQHSRVHSRHIEILVGQGFTALETRNRIVEKFTHWCNRRAPKTSLAISAGLEHLIVILARQILSDPETRTGNMHPEMARLWRWHALEETEHKAVVFDVLKQVAPGHPRRVLVMLALSIWLPLEIFTRLSYMLWKDKVFFSKNTWRSAGRFLFGESGLLHGTRANYFSWYRKDFHPNDIDDRPLIEAHLASIEAEIAI